MSNPPGPAPITDPTKAEEIPLEDIDALLEAEDPGFTASLEEVRKVEIDSSVNIEATITDESLGPEDAREEKAESRFERARLRFRAWRISSRQRLKNRLTSFLKDTLIFLKSRPKEFLQYSLIMLRHGIKKGAIPLIAFKKAEPAQKIMALALTAIIVGSLWILLANFKGIWIPSLTQPILRSFEPGADFVETFNPKEEGESFYTAFPQERYEYLFPKMKVNLRRTAQNPLPMGAFELIILLDSKDTGIEVRDREVEFFDLLQRVFEDETFNDLESEMGKAKVKTRLKREMNQKLTQGWVKDVSFKTFILKP